MPTVVAAKEVMVRIIVCEPPVGGRSPFETIGAGIRVGVGVGEDKGIAVGNGIRVGAGVLVGVIFRVGVADGVADSDT